MYCDIIKEMPNRRLKIKVYGDRHVSICGEKIRYVDAHRVVDAKDYNVKKIEREKSKWELLIKLRIGRDRVIKQ